jgi:tetratricopeptide (TPR) repeat protein
MPEPIWLLEAHCTLGATLLWRGQIVRAHAALEQAVIHYQPQQHQTLIAFYTHDLGVVSLCLRVMALWGLGYPDQALARMHETLRVAHELGHPLSLAFALNFTAMLHHLRGEGQGTQERAEALATLSSEQGFSTFWALGTMLQGAALTMQARWEEGITQIQRGLEAYGQGFRKTMYLAYLAVGYAGGGQVEEGVATVAQALQFVEQNDERFYEAELYRLKGELALQLGTRDWGLGAGSPSPQASSLKPQVPSGAEQEAEGYFLKAIAIAQKQQAKSLELRAVMSLVRLRQRQAKDHATRTTQHVPRSTYHATRTTQHESRSKLAEAHEMLTTVYNWFTEGFGTKDLQEAKALLEVLQ